MHLMKDAQRKHTRLVRSAYKTFARFYGCDASDWDQVYNILYSLHYFCHARDIDFRACLEDTEESFLVNKQTFEAFDADAGDALRDWR
ncbi:MAG TPA: hypothetical protein PK264_19330 [Hyphomicrobiaceae bacterium]|nr:hypothetical protein [Hyphomicrobiaceae bacterium]